MIRPMISTFDKSTEAYQLTEQFINNNEELKSDLEKHFWAYQSLTDLIPQTNESLFSGNLFPLQESWQDLQISFTLCAQGLYKQSMNSLRSTFELSLISLYMNIDDKGHIDVKDWLKSRLDTPRITHLWKKISKHNNFKQIQESYNLKEKLINLNNLHNFVHTKGYKYSNYMGKRFKSNFQTFEEEAFMDWFNYMKEVVKLSVVCHLVKYPLGIMEYDFGEKFGIDIPMMGVLQQHQVHILKDIIEEDIILEIEKIGLTDSHVKEIMTYVNTLPNMTEEDVEQQIIKQEMDEIEHNGLNIWLKNYDALYSNFSTDSQCLKRREFLIKWANDNHYIEPKIIRYVYQIKDLKDKGYSFELVKELLNKEHWGSLEDIYEDPEKEIKKLKNIFSRAFTNN